MLQRALVTGGAGFIGSHLVELLHREGVSVTVIDDLSRGHISNLTEGILIHPIDIASTSAASIIRTGDFDVVFHLAANVDLRASVEDGVRDARNNVLGALNVLEAVRAAGSTARVVFSSTGGAIYSGAAPLPLSEDAPHLPDSAYGCAKLSVEYYLRYYERVHGVQSVVLRYANVYGPRQSADGDAGVIAVFAKRLLKGQRLVVNGDGGQTRDFVYAGDVARANLLAAKAILPLPGDINSRAFNIGCGRETSIGELAATMHRLLHGTSPIEYGPARSGEVRRSSLDASKAARTLGWTPKVSLDEGLGRTVAWFTEREEHAVPSFA